MQSTNAINETIADAKNFNRKLQGKKASASQTPTDPNTPAPTTISSSQQSYDQLIQHLAGLNSVLEAEPSYTPNETDLQTATIQTKIAELTAKNTAVATAYASISNSRIARNETLYSATTGLVETANEVKKYVKSVFVASSPQFAQFFGQSRYKPTAKRNLSTTKRNRATSIKLIATAISFIMSAIKNIVTASKNIITAERNISTAERNIVTAKRNMTTDKRIIATAERKLITFLKSTFSSGKEVQPLTAVSCNCEICGSRTSFFRKKSYLSRKYAVTKFATDMKPRNVESTTCCWCSTNSNNIACP